MSKTNRKRAPVQVVDMNGPWDFTYTKSLDPQRPAVPGASDFSAKMPVPGYWDDNWQSLQRTDWWDQAELAPSPVTLLARSALPDEKGYEKLRYLRGVGWYRRVVELPSPSAGRKGFTAILEFSQVVSCAHVWVNGRHAGSHAGCCAGFAIDISKLCRPGQDNEIVVAVGNHEVEPGTVTSSLGVCGGIVGPVRLRLAGGGAVRDLFVRAGENLQTVAWTAAVKLPRKRGRYSLAWRIRTADSAKQIAAGVEPIDASGEQTIEWSTYVPDIQPWSPDDPNLYVAEVDLKSGRQVWDRFSRRFGVRRWSYEGHKLKLNGRCVFTRAGFRHISYFPGYRSIPLDKECYLKYARRLKQLGFNTMQFFVYPPAACYEAADEVGIIVHVRSKEYQPEELISDDQVSQAACDVANMVRTLRNFPSVSTYTLSGECRCDERFLAALKRLGDATKQVDPGALVMASHAARGIEYSFNYLNSDELLVEPFVHHTNRLRKLLACSDVVGQYPNGILSYNCPGDATWRDMDRRASVYNRPLESHEIGMKASYLDLRNERRYKDLFPPVCYRGLRAQLEAAGLLDKAQAYYRMSCRVQQAVRKYCVEEVRMCKSLSGYEYTPCTDWFSTYSYPGGFMNEFGELKWGDSARSIRRYQNESVLLLDFDDRRMRTFWAGDSFQATWMVSLFGPDPIKKGTLTWRITDGKKVLLNGRQVVHDVPQGDVTLLVPLCVRWPAIDKPAKLNLQGTLSGDGYRITNDWDFWLFPRTPAPRVRARCDRSAYERLGGRYRELATTGKDIRLRIVSKLTRDHLAHLRRGGDVLLLGTEPFRSWAIDNPIATGHSSRPEHQIGTLIHDHPVFEHIPHEGFGDWQFYPMLLAGSSTVHFDDPDLPFDPILEVISSDKHVRRQASVFEAAVGKGRLFAFSCSFDLESPSAVTLLDAVLAYVQSKGFRPRTRISPAALGRLIARYSKAEAIIARRKVDCPRVDAPPLGDDGSFSRKAWRKAKPLRSSLAAVAAAVTEAEQKYDAGGGLAGVKIAGKARQERALAASVRALHDDEYLYLDVEVSARGFLPSLSSFYPPYRQNDYVGVRVPWLYCEVADVGGKPFLAADRHPGLRPLASVKKGKGRMRFGLALPLERSLKSGGLVTETLDVDVTVFHAEKPGAAKHELKHEPKQAIPFHLALRLKT